MAEEIRKLAERMNVITEKSSNVVELIKEVNNSTNKLVGMVRNFKI